MVAPGQPFAPRQSAFPRPFCASVLQQGIGLGNLAVREQWRYEHKMSLRRYLSESTRVLELAAECWSEGLVEDAISTITCALSAGKPLLVCGNGGSASDAMHISGELVGRFLRER